MEQEPLTGTSLVFRPETVPAPSIPAHDHRRCRHRHGRHQGHGATQFPDLNRGIQREGRPGREGFLQMSLGVLGIFCSKTNRVVVSVQFQPRSRTEKLPSPPTLHWCMPTSARMANPIHQPLTNVARPRWGRVWQLSWRGRRRTPNLSRLKNQMRLGGSTWRSPAASPGTSSPSHWTPQRH